MGTNCCGEDDFDEVMLWKLSNDDLAVAIVADELEYTNAIKRWSECSVDINEISTDEIFNHKLYTSVTKCFKG